MTVIAGAILYPSAQPFDPLQRPPPLPIARMIVPLPSRDVRPTLPQPPPEPPAASPGAPVDVNPPGIGRFSGQPDRLYFNRSTVACTNLPTRLSVTAVVADDHGLGVVQTRHRSVALSSTQGGADPGIAYLLAARSTPEG